MRNHRPVANLVLLLLGSSVSTFCNAVVLVGMLVYLAGFEDSPRLIGLVQGFAYLPLALFSYFAGAWVDRHNHRQILVWTDALRGLAMIIGGFALAAIQKTGTEKSVGLVVLLPLVFVMGTLQSLFIPGVVVFCVDVQHQLETTGRKIRVLGLRNSSTHAATLAGNAIGGSLYLLLGLPALLVFNGIGFVLSAVSEIFLYEEPINKECFNGKLDDAAAPRSPPATFLAALRTVISTPPVDLYLLVQTLIPLLTMVLPSYIGHVLGLPSQALGLVFALLLAGSIGSGLVAGLRGLPIPKGHRHLYLPGLVAGILLGAIAVSGQDLAWPLGAILLTALGYCLGRLYLLSIEAVQVAAPPGRGGRGHGLVEGLSSVVTPASYFVGAALFGSTGLGANSISVTAWIFGIAGLLSVYSLVASRIKNTQ